MPQHAPRRWPALLVTALLIPGLGGTASAAPGPGATTLAIDHKDVGCIVGDRYPRLDACFQPPGALGNAKVLFRAGDAAPWYAVELIAEGQCHVAYLPRPLPTTTEIQYYVAAVDRSFNELQRPQTAPETAYRARVVRNPGDCDRARIAASVSRLAQPIVVAVARTGGGAPAALGALLVGFSQEGVIMAGAAAAGGAAAGGAAAALVAAVAGGGDEETACVNARQIAAQGQDTVAVDDATVCAAQTIQCRAGLTLRTCLGGLCTASCSLYYELSDNRRFTCGTLPNCYSGDASAVQDPSFCLSAAQQVAQACQ